MWAYYPYFQKKTLEGWIGFHDSHGLEQMAEQRLPLMLDLVAEVNLPVV